MSYCYLASVLALLGIASLPVTAATVAVRTGPVSSLSTFPIGGSSGDSSFAVTWTQSAGTTYSGGTITATLRSTNGALATISAHGHRLLTQTQGVRNGLFGSPNGSRNHRPLVNKIGCKRAGL
jgi:hypothetical protein